MVAGFSIATKLRIWSKWFCITSRIIPKLSKYPPRPSVPNGSLKVICTCAMLSLFHPVFNILFPNLRNSFRYLYICIGTNFLNVSSAFTLPECHEILNHLFTQIMINTVHLVFTEQFGQMVTKFQWTSSIPTKRLFNDNTSPSPENELYS